MKVISRISLVVILTIALLTGGLVGWFYSGIGLPRLSSLNEYKSAQNSKIFAADGTLLTTLHGDQNREVVALERIPDAMQKAVIAIEDKDFYKHTGINWKAVMRALWANVVKGGVVQGGSTITQQYVKNAYVGQKRTLWRKMQEAYLAFQLDKKYSKDKIMELYLNDIYFGQGSYGIYTAARKYFDKSPEELALSECAMLACVIRSPSYYDPYKQPQAVLERRNLVLHKMDEIGYVTHAQAVAAAKQALNVQTPNRVYVPPPAPYFCDYITELVRKTYGDQAAFRGGLRIYTTIDLKLQSLAEKTLLRQLKLKDGPDAAIACIDPRTGYIKAMVGGKNYYQNQFNAAAKGNRQPGSAFKVFVLTRAIADGISPDQTYESGSPRTIKMADGTEWKVKNYSDGSGGGSMTVESATIHSVNVVFAQLIMDLDPARVANMAKQMGIQSPVESNPAIALGGLATGVTPLEMASAFGTLANNGVHAVPRSIYKITDADGNVIVENKPETNTIVTPKVAAELNRLLSEVVSSGTGRGAGVGRPQAGKTGTTEDHADAWFVGYTPDLTTAVWVGYPQGRISMGGMCGGDLPATIWRDFMSQALKGVPSTAFAKGDEASAELPNGELSDTVSVEVCDETGMLATPACPGSMYKEFKRGDEPTSFCTTHRSVQSPTVPNVVGMNKASARATITEAGYVVSESEEESSEQSPGFVVSQTPSGGTPLEAGKNVTIVVAKGTDNAVVPNVVGLSESSARSKISNAGFTSSVSYTVGPNAGTVVSQSPGAGTDTQPGSVVLLVVQKSN